MPLANYSLFPIYFAIANEHVNAGLTEFKICTLLPFSFKIKSISNFFVRLLYNCARIPETDSSKLVC